ncbi:MAG TPA: hypothetical protein VM032_17245, partial [Vicinamibacterales bacterium]|nr:hypothetical protein [Vicinamibacterales bacterium]
ESLGQIGPRQVVAIREALVEIASSRPAMAKAALPKAARPAASPMNRATVLKYAAPRRARMATAPIEVSALRPRVRVAAPMAAAR